jgi:flagellin-like protein
MKILKSKKALSPVVASIILIAVTVAVSIAVAAWMGALTFNFMATEQGQITNLAFYTGTGTSGMINATFQNSGTTPIIISELWVNNIKYTTNLSPDLTTTPINVPANSQRYFAVNMTITAGSQYELKLVSSKGNAFPRTGTAPT